MKYIVIDQRRNGTGDQFTEEFSVLEDAIKEAEHQWDHLTRSEQNERTIYVLESVNPDEDAPDHFDGNPVWTDGKETMMTGKDRYQQYLEECEEIAEQCKEEGYPSHGSNYDLRVADLRKYYPDLFD